MPTEREGLRTDTDAERGTSMPQMGRPDLKLMGQSLVDLVVMRAKTIDEGLEQLSAQSTWAKIVKWLLPQRAQSYRSELLLFAAAATDECLTDISTPVAQDIRKEFREALVRYACEHFPSLRRSPLEWETRISERLEAYRAPAIRGDLHGLGDLASRALDLQTSVFAGMFLAGRYAPAVDATLDVLQDWGIIR